ncbi:hypothetical protein M441DRAFT_23514 [Trichoderma asperellum CBS 433.97]|uniref:Zn(2)-C6 fungal-type domain-containing protein n=1 Tax=Trichoderma asperellum (strain ATCC 204424 / CBS 433.97 / NBRC 101777) TaxID=1042311 RepID=A0A2T3ZKD0_TRIA4|nr:hypothetical protein M441DRAFT_23514 [Trichoderma asperellum CBS 433.97]PTB45268.1 hypothetical protein M441DRAFT_23514 [Trichoderma asperellum CBS 433.97]
MTRMMRGLAVPRIVRGPDACLTCRRHGFRCNWGLPTCVTCDKNGYECIQPISAIGYEDYIRNDDAKQTTTLPESASNANQRKSKAKKKKKNKKKAEPKTEAKTEIKTKSRFDDGIIGYRMDLTPIFQTRDPSIPIPEKTATHQCTRQPAPLYASGLESGVAFGVGTESTSSSGPVAVSEPTSESAPDSESEPCSASESTSTSASTIVSGSALSDSTFESEFVTRIKRHMYKSQQRELEHTHRYVKRSDPTSSDDADKDHDYAVYYDYDYDTDPDVLQDEEDLDPDDGPTDLAFGPITLSTLKSHPQLSDIYMVKNSWQGPGEPPLKTRIDDYITYMKENHLTPRVPLPLTLLASCDYTASDTLFYYENRPANCCVAEIPDINPVNPKLVRLGYASPLALQLVIAQRANHREVSSAILPTGESAERFLIDTIAQFGPKIDSYLAGSEDEMPSLFIASTVIALVERARVDKLSQAYNHPTAAKAILNRLHSLDSEEIFINMPECLIEYYMHTVSFACIAANPITAAGVPFITAPQLLFVDSLAAKGYLGKLCGSWLDILATIPHIFRLGAIMYRRKLGTSTFQDASGDFLNFGDIEDRLMASAPCSNGDPIHTIDKIAFLFKIAALLYLWSLLDEPLLQDQGIECYDEDAELQDEDFECDDQNEWRQKMHKVTMKSMLKQAERILPTIPVEDNLNLALCWPMLIMGCFTKNKDTEKFIEQRLIAIVNQFGVGNPLETLFVSKYLWNIPVNRRSPWMIWHYIQNSRCRECTCPKCIPFLF